jgi:DNA-binding response OmpR family regulator
MTSTSGGPVINRGRRTVVALSGDSQRAELMDMFLADATNDDVVFVGSIARGYSRIKQLTPDLVILLAGIDDLPACQLLSMLKMDSHTSDIPVVTWMTSSEQTECEDIIAELDGHLLRAFYGRNVER